MVMKMRYVPILLAGALSGCLSVPNRADSPVPLATNVDLAQFMGYWFVIAHIPPSLDRDAYDAVESYRLEDDGRIATTYRRRHGSHDAKLETSRPTGYVVAGTNNALWGMRFLPLIAAEYRIAHLSPDGAVTIIGRSDLDYVWLMSRSPAMGEADYARYVSLMQSWGYDTSKLERIPHRAKP